MDLVDYAVEKIKHYSALINFITLIPLISQEELNKEIKEIVKKLLTPTQFRLISYNEPEITFPINEVFSDADPTMTCRISLYYLSDPSLQYPTYSILLECLETPVLRINFNVNNDGTIDFYFIEEGNQSDLFFNQWVPISLLAAVYKIYTFNSAEQSPGKEQ